MAMRRIVTLIIITLVLVCGCTTKNQDQRSTPSAEFNKNELIRLTNCNNPLNIRAELANPFDVSGYGCYNISDYPTMVFYESNSKKSLEVSTSKYISTNAYKIYVSLGSDYALVVSKDARDLIEKKYPGIRFVEAKSDEPVLTEDDNKKLECSQFMSSYVWDYLYGDGHTLNELVPTVKELLLNNYKGLKDKISAGLIEPDTAESNTLASNLSKPLNNYCLKGEPDGLINWNSN